MYICIIYIERLVLYNYVYSLMQVNLNFMCGLGLGGGSSLDTRGIFPGPNLRFPMVAGVALDSGPGND